LVNQGGLSNLGGKLSETHSHKKSLGHYKIVP